MNWRPIDWKNPYWIRGEHIYQGDFEKASAFEKGADAILDALIGRGTAERQLGRDGWLVFIPEKEE